MPLSRAFWIDALSLLNDKLRHQEFNSAYQEWDSHLDTIPANETFFSIAQPENFTPRKLDGA